MSGQHSSYYKLILLVLVLIITLFALSAIEGFWNSQSRARPEEIKKAVLTACVQCYALEGSYPPSLDYLEDHYGVILDRDKYYFYYEVFASNVIPNVEVYEKE